MMASIKKLKVGQVLWSVTRQKMGNTMLSSDSLFEVVVESIADDGKSLMARWNGNPARQWRERDVKRLKVDKPVVVEKGICGSVRYGSAKRKETT